MALVQRPHGHSQMEGTPLRRSSSERRILGLRDRRHEQMGAPELPKGQTRSGVATLRSASETQHEANQQGRANKAKKTQRLTIAPKRSIPYPASALAHGREPLTNNTVENAQQGSALETRNKEDRTHFRMDHLEIVHHRRPIRALPALKEKPAKIFAFIDLNFEHTRAESTTNREKISRHASPDCDRTP